MIWLYRILYLPALLVALPYYGLRMWRRGGYKKDFQHRFGRFRQLPATAPGKKRVWLQAVSVGEVLAVGPLIEALGRSGKVELVLTTTTSTGYEEARKRYSTKVFCVGIFPLDFWLFSRLAWKRIQPDAIILTESELWPEHLHRAKVAGIPSFLVNARLSDRSYGRYQKVPNLTKRMLTKFSGIFAASETDKSRIETLGAEANDLYYFGSIKLDTALPPIISDSEKADLIHSLGFKTEESDSSALPFVILGSSTWPGEEEALISIVNRMIGNGIDCNLLLVPRHAERAHEILDILKKQPLPWHQRSGMAEPQKPVRIYLADTTGELSQLTQIATLSFIGKSLMLNRGGQSPIDAAGLGVPLIFGPNMNNFRDISQALIHEKAAIEVNNTDELETTILRLHQNQDERKAMAAAGKSWHTANQGSSERIAKLIMQKIQV